MKINIIEFLLLPEEYLPQYVKDTKDMYEYRHILKQLLPDDYALNYLLDILLTAVTSGIRFRTLDCLKVVQAILKNNAFGQELNGRTVSKLFFLFKTFVFHKNQEIRACANLLIRFQRLDNKNVSWLVENWDKSEHILNRLLRYPEKHPLITEWAANAYRQGRLKDRQAEAIALLIDEDIPPFVNDDDSVIVWAIYYSRNSDEVKGKLLKERFSLGNLASIREVALRLKLVDVIEFMRMKVHEQSKSR
jgi:hypothetical protein